MFFGFGVLSLLTVVFWRKLVIPRGIRNNNPGNLRDNGTKWQGMVGRDDRGFCIFDSAANGLRAAAQTALSYQLRRGIRTLAAFGDLWAPPYDNPGAKKGEYGERLARQLGLSATETFTVSEHLPRLLGAIVVNENGYNPYNFDTLVVASTAGMQAKGLA